MVWTGALGCELVNGVEVSHQTHPLQIGLECVCSVSEWSIRWKPRFTIQSPKIQNNEVKCLSSFYWDLTPMWLAEMLPQPLTLPPSWFTETSRWASLCSSLCLWNTGLFVNEKSQTHCSIKCSASSFLHHAL